MSFEQPVFSFSYPGGEPPTPNKTPTSPNFFLNSFQTPKQDSRSHGPFSPWSPSFPSATGPDFKTPTRLSFTTPTQTPEKSSRHSPRPDLETEIASHVHHLSPNPNLPLPPVEPGRQLSSSPTPALASASTRQHFNPADISTTLVKPTLDTNVGTCIDSAGSMQTPPPTSTSASRRKAQQAQGARLVKESAEKGRRMSFPALASANDVGPSTSQAEESPQHFQALQFSPEVFGFPTSGPATAPVYPQHKLFWDPEQGGDTMNIDFSIDDTFTTFGIQKNLDPFSSAEELGNAIQFPTSPSFNLLSTSGENLEAFASTHVDTPKHTATSVTMARKPSRGHAVNPSLLFSSPSRAAESSSSMPPTSQTIADDILKPYALQLRDAQIEMEMNNARRLKRKRGPPSGDSPAVKAALQTLRDDGVDRASNSSEAAEEVSGRRTKSRNSSGHSRENRGSGQLPLQKQRSRTNLHMSRNTPQAHKRTSVTLTVDANGRAKTETKVFNGARPSSRMQVDGDEDSDSSSSSSSVGMVVSQPQSFVYPHPKQKQPPPACFATDRKSHSQKSSYASTKGSSSAAHTLLETTNRRRPSNLYIQSSQDSQTSYTDIAGQDDKSEASTVIDSDEDHGDAQSELKKILRSRSSKKKSSKQSTWPGPRDKLFDQRRAYPIGPCYLSESVRAGHQEYNYPYSNISPTAITDPEVVTPSSGRSNLSSDSVRCIFESCYDDGRLMIQWYI